MKEAAARAALQYIEDDMMVGVGTGSTVDYFITALSTLKHRISGTVASSIRTETRLKSLGLPVYDLNTVDQIQVYIDGADEINDHFQMIKGGGGAHTREKLLAKVAKKFICIADESKYVALLGKEFPVPVEVIPMARSYVARELVKLGGHPVYREGFLTDNGNIILDIYNLTGSSLTETLNKLEDQINSITGVLDNGIFASRTADKLLLGQKDGSVKELKLPK